MIKRIAISLFVCAAPALAQPNLLGSGRTVEQIKSLLIPADHWQPFPAAADRAAWEALSDDAKTSAIRRGEAALDYDWPALKASDFLGFARTGNRSHYEGLRYHRRERLRDLVMAECVEGKGRFMDQIANGVWIICEETWWGVPAHMYLQKAGTGLPDIEEPVVDLSSADTAAHLAWTAYLLGPQLEQVSPLILPRLRWEIDRRMLTPALERDDFWWMGFPDRAVNNWNPWINSNWLTCALLIEQDADRRAQAVEKILRSLDKFVNHYPKDGGCNEGPGYWGFAGASLFDCLDLMHSATDGALSVYGNALIKEIGRYIYRVHIAGNYFINFADAGARTNPSADLVYRYGKHIDDPVMMAFGAHLSQQPQGWGGGNVGGWRQLQALFNREELQNTTGAPPNLRDVWLPELQVFAARDRGGSARGFYVAAKGGHNAESHNHNDVGSFIVYRDGLPVLIDPGVGTYTAQTFSRRRYEIWTMQSAYHNLPTINGVMQQNGRAFAAKALSYHNTAASASLAMDIAGAYPPEAGLISYKRTVRINRGKNVEIADAYERNSAGEIALTLMTPSAVSLAAPGRLVLKGDGENAGSATLVYDPKKFEAAIEQVVLNDDRLSRSWRVDHLTRILLKAANAPLRDTWTVTVVP